jgi:hypothetical protein
MTNVLTENQTVKASNSLVYKTNKIVGKEHIFVTIRLNDECKNGHQDFAITANIYETGKPKTDRYFIGGGCCHDDILKAFPQFKIFVDLHLCDYKGIPMHPTANGFYHLKEGFNNTKPESEGFAREYCEYYRISLEQFNVLRTSFNEVDFALKLRDLGILEQWEKQAKEAIIILEGLTETKFVIDSKRTQLNFPSEEKINEHLDRVKSGYYTPEAQQQREIAKLDGIIAKLAAERDKDINKAQLEFEVKKQVLIIGGEKALKNCIFYNHTKQLAFNWTSYGNISDELVNKIMAEMQLPEGVTVVNKKGKD